MLKLFKMPKCDIILCLSIAFIILLLTSTFSPKPEPMAEDEIFQAGYDYAVETARLKADNGDTYIITFGIDDNNEYKRG